jgi:hypothetical protein
MGNILSVIPDMLEAVEKLSLLKPEEYLDPGSGSFIIQILLASLVGVGFAFRSFWGKLIRKITGKPEEAIDEDYDDDEE